MKGLVFAQRTIKEILREPLSYIFCLGFPLLMLLIMSVLNESLPKEAGMSLFALENLAPGTVYFGLHLYNDIFGHPDSRGPFHFPDGAAACVPHEGGGFY